MSYLATYTLRGNAKPSGPRALLGIAVDVPNLFVPKGSSTPQQEFKYPKTIQVTVFGALQNLHLGIWTLKPRCRYSFPTIPVYIYRYIYICISICIRIHLYIYIYIVPFTVAVTTMGNRR